MDQYYAIHFCFVSNIWNSQPLSDNNDQHRFFFTQNIHNNIQNKNKNWKSRLLEQQREFRDSNLNRQVLSFNSTVILTTKPRGYQLILYDYLLSIILKLRGPIYQPLLSLNL